MYCPAHYPSSKFVIKTHFLCWAAAVPSAQSKHESCQRLLLHTRLTWSPTVLAHVCSQKRATPTSATDYCCPITPIFHQSRPDCVWTLMASQIHPSSQLRHLNPLVVGCCRLVPLSHETTPFFSWDYQVLPRRSMCQGGGHCPNLIGSPWVSPRIEG